MLEKYLITTKMNILGLLYNPLLQLQIKAKIFLERERKQKLCFCG